MSAVLERPAQSAPDRSRAQRLAALQRANDVRSARARLKRDLKAGRRDFLALVMSPPEYLLTAKVWDLLLEVPRYGRVRVNKVFVRAEISPSKTFGGITDRQRAKLKAEVDRLEEIRQATVRKNAPARRRLPAPDLSRPRERRAEGGYEFMLSTEPPR